MTALDHDDLSDDERTAVEHLLYRLADDELVLAERYTEWQVTAPTLESDLALANIAQDELGHARLWYDLLQDLGYSESELIYERDPGEFRHATLAEVPFEEGDWADAVVRGYLYDVAENCRLEALEDSAHPRIANRVGKVRGEEEYHREHARNWLERLAGDEDGRRRLQTALDRLFPHALTLFEPTDEAVEDDIVGMGIRRRGLDDLREEWLATVEPFLESVGLRLPMDPDDPADRLPDAVGRDRSHTDDWFDLHDEMTRTYRELGRTETTRIMDKPTDE
jgi:ring-1,2-phenylacetyl-CoA epoxidase subunit PaaC